ncbi:hypothetical protein DICPUDRAFT_42073, partial [Dictyostelium purpureum]
IYSLHFNICLLFFFLLIIIIANFATDSWIAFLVSNSGNAPKVSLHTAVLNPVNNTMLVLGGITPKGNASSTFIKYDILQDSWGTPLNFSGIENAPSPRYGHVALTTLDNKMYIYGGRNENEVFGDIFKYDMEKDTWEKISVNGSKRWGHSGVSYSTENSFYFFGGQSTTEGGYLDDIIRYDFEYDTWITMTPGGSEFSPKARSLHTSTLTLTNHMVIYGGRNFQNNETIFDDLHIFYVEEHRWINVTLNSTSRNPEKKYGHTAILTPMNTVLIYGGNQSSTAASTSIYKFDLSTTEWDFISSASGLGPEARSGHTAVATLFNTMLVFGGQDGKVFYNNLFKYNVINSVLRSTSDGTTLVVLLSLVGVMIIGLCFALDIMAEKNEIARLEQLEKDAIAKNNEIALKKILQEKKDKLKNQPLFEKF